MSSSSRNRRRYAAPCAWCASIFIAAVSNAPGQQMEATAEPVYVYARERVDPVAQTTIGADELTGLDKVAAALQRVPNTSVNAGGANSFTDVLGVRGLANTPNFSKQAVTFYVDGVPSSSTYTNFPQWGELGQLIVFRGPQGDFFGKNSEAGIVEINTFRPDAVPRRTIVATVGSNDFARTNFLAAGPLGGATAFAKVEGGYFRRDGFLENTFLGTRPDFQEQSFARGTLRLLPAKEWEFSLSAECYHARDGVQRFAPLFARDPFQVAFDFDGRTDIAGNAESLIISRQLEIGRLMFISSHRDWHLEPYEADLDYSPAPLVQGKIELGQRQIAQEIRLESSEDGRDWTYRMGLFADRVLSDGTEVFALPGLIKTIDFNDAESEFAIFGRATRRFGSALEITGGMRLAYEEESIARTRRLSIAAGTAFDSDRAEWNIQPRIAFAYHCSPDATAYFSSTYGYKNGGFSFLETDPRLASFESERVWSNEAGAYGHLFDRRVELRCAVFLNQVEDYQVERPAVPPDITVFNAPRVVAWGGELEVTAKPAKNLQFRGAAGFTQSEFREYHDPFTGVSYRGNRTPFTPDFTASFEMRYSFCGMFAQAEVIASGETFYDEANTATMREAPHAQGNVRVGYENSRFNLSVFCDNVSDARFFTQKITYAAVGTPAAPRTFGVTFRVQL
jgi:iron complex outermembrane recepter protein